MSMQRIATIIPSVLGSIKKRPLNGHVNGKVSIDCFDESMEMLAGLLGQAREAGILPSMRDISTIKLNGRVIPLSVLD